MSDLGVHTCAHKVLGISHITDTAKRMDEDEVGQTDPIDSMGRLPFWYCAASAR